MINRTLIKKLDDLEYCMKLLETVRSKCTEHGFTEQANHADALSQDINFCHYDAMEAEGPIIGGKS